MEALQSSYAQFRKAKVAEYGLPPPPTPLQGESLEKAVEQKLGALPGKAITLTEIQRDKLTRIAEANWSVGRNVGAKPVFNAGLVEEIYQSELTVEKGNKTVPLQRVMVLEISQYLENYLWPNFDPDTASFAHVMSIILMVNEKFRENVPAWRCFHDREEIFPLFFKRVLTLKGGEHEFTIREKTNYLLFMIHCFQSLEDEMVRLPVLKLSHLKLWHALSFGRLQLEFFAHPQVLIPWKRLLKKEAKDAKKAGGQFNPKDDLEVRFLPSLIQEFLEVLESAVVVHNGNEIDSNGDEGAQVDASSLLYCERFAEFLIDLLSQLPTRRFIWALMEDAAVVINCRMSPLYSHGQGRLFAQLVDLLRFYEGFEIDEQTGTQLTDDDVLLAHSSRLQAFQLLVFKQVPKLQFYHSRRSKTWFVKSNDTSSSKGAKFGDMMPKKKKKDAAPKVNLLHHNQPSCYGCGSILQTSEAEAPGYIAPETFAVKKKHHQLKTVLCGRCRLLSQGQMIPAVGGVGGYGEGKGYIPAEQLRTQLSHLRHQKALVVKLVSRFSTLFVYTVHSRLAKHVLYNLNFPPRL